MACETCGGYGEVVEETGPYTRFRVCPSCLDGRKKYCVDDEGQKAEGSRLEAITRERQNCNGEWWECTGLKPWFIGGCK